MSRRIEVTRRNGVEHAWCNACNGSGQQHWAHTDPEKDWSEPCEVCEAQGQWRVTPLDPLERMQNERRLWRRRAPSRPEYVAARQRAMRPAPLPSEQLPLTFAEAA